MAAGLCASAQAGPWVPQQGGIYARTAVSQEEIRGLTAYRVDSYAEYGLTDQWLLSGKVELVCVDGADFADAEAYRMTLRRALWSNRGFRLAAEGGVVSGAASVGLRGCSGIGGEARLSAGWSGKLLGAQSYMSVDGGGIFYEDACTRTKLELALGQEVLPRIWAVNQVWVETASDGGESIKLDTEVRVHTDVADLSLGYRQEISGRFDETAWVVAISVRR